MKLLLITSRDIDRKGGESALIMGRHAALYREFGIETDVVFLHKDTAAGCSDREGIRFLPGAAERVYELVTALLTSGAYRGAVLSGLNDGKLAAILQDSRKKHGVAVIIDVHGSLREVYEYCSPDPVHFWGCRFLYAVDRHRFARIMRSADFAFVVSDESVAEVNQMIGKNSIRYLKVRCGCEDGIDVDRYFSDRAEVRRKLGIQDDEIAFVYSGSKDPWQKFNDTVALFERISKTCEACRFFFYMDLDRETKESLAKRLGSGRVAVRWVPVGEMRRELAGLDVGVMLRDDTWTNRVAFPNKFSDYVHGGLGIVMSDVVREPYRIAQENSLRLIPESEILKPSFYAPYIEQRRNQLAEYVRRCGDVVEKELLYGTQVFNQCAALAYALGNPVRPVR